MARAGGAVGCRLGTTGSSPACSTNQRASSRRSGLRSALPIGPTARQCVKERRAERAVSDACCLDGVGTRVTRGRGRRAREHPMQKRGAGPGIVGDRRHAFGGTLRREQLPGFVGRKKREDRLLPDRGSMITARGFTNPCTPPASWIELNASARRSAVRTASTDGFLPIAASRSASVSPSTTAATAISRPSSRDSSASSRPR